MSKKRKETPTEKDTENDTKKLKTDSSSKLPDQAWLDLVLGKKELAELAAKAPKEWKDDKQSFKAYQDVFSQIANRLLNEVILMINGDPHRFIEIEFYYDCANHPDHFTHGHPVQSKFGKWYFHRTGHSMTAYKSGTYKGMDISIGGHKEHPDSQVKEKTIRGGILIRGIQPLFESKDKGEKKKKKEGFIEGPSTVVDYILNHCGSKGVDEFVKANFKGQEDGPSVIGCEKFYIKAKDKDFKEYLPQTSIAKMFSGKKDETKLAVYASPRVGLTLKKELEFLNRFLLSSYRYHSLVSSMTKGKHHMIISLHQQGRSSKDIATIMGSGQGTIDKYIEQFKKGEKGGKKLTSYFTKKTLSTEEFAGLYGAWNASYGSL